MPLPDPSNFDSEFQDIRTNTQPIVNRFPRP